MQNASNFNNPIALGRLASDPSGGQNGAMYYNTTTNLFRAYVNGAWANLTTGSGGITQLTGDVTAGPGSGSQVASLVATSNSTLTTLSALSLPYSQITGAPAAITALTGDATASGPGSAAITLATVNSNIGSFGSSTSIPSFTVNAKGLITAASGNAVVAPAGTLSGTTLNSTVVTSSLTTVGTIASGTWNASAIAAIHGGTGLTSYTTGDLIYASATNTLLNLGIGTTGQILTVVSGVPAWSTPATSGTVTSVSVVSANGLAGTVATATTTPAITLSTTVTAPVLAGNGTAISAATTTGTGSTVVLSASPTLTGTLTAAAASLSGALNMNSNQINNVSNPTSAQDAATKAYVDAAISGLTWQGPAQAYANVNVPLTGGSTLTIDGYAAQNGDLVILANQTTASQNGEYSVSGIGTAYLLTANGLPTAVGDAWLITHGTVFANSAFVATAVVPAATFIEFAGPTALIFNSPLSITGNTVSISQATTSTNGYLSSTDWNTFNNKQPAGSYITALTGDATASGPGSAALTLASVNSNTGSFAIASITVNAKGLITAASAATTTGTGSVVLSASPTLTGTVGAAAITATGTVSTPTLALTNASQSLLESYVDATTLTHATTTSPAAFSFSSSSFGSMIIEYQMKVASTGDVRTGKIQIAANDTATTVSLDDQYTETADVLIASSASIVSHTVTVTFTSTQVTNDITMRAKVIQIRA